MKHVSPVSLFVVALALRLALVLPMDRPLVSDERDYDALGWTLATTARYCDGGHPTAYRPIGYPAFVAAVYAVAGRAPRAVRIAQAALDAGTALLLFLALRGRSRRGAIAAAALWSFYPPAIVTASLLYSESLFCFLLSLAALWLLEEPDRSDRLRFSLGVVLGALVLIKAASLLLVLLLPWLALRGEARWRRAAVIAAGVCLVVVPWVWRNARVMGVPTLATSTSAVLLIGNHPNATGGYAPNVPDSMLPRSGDEVAASREAARAAWSYIAAHPGAFGLGIARRWAHLVMGEGELAVLAFHPNPADPRVSYRAKVKELGMGRLLILWVPYAMLLLAGVAGLLSRPWDALTGLFLALLLAWLVAHGLTFGGGRYHAPWMPLLVAFAAERLTTTPGSRPLRGMSALAWLALAAFSLTLWAIEAAHYL
jgi:hypothetical protein